MHIHVTKADAEAKIWLEPNLIAAFFINFTIREQREIMQLAKANLILLKNLSAAVLAMDMNIV